jgi:hypothetical protein
VAICIGPEYGTVGPELVKEAAKEAVRGVGFDVLLVYFTCADEPYEKLKRALRAEIDEGAWSQLYLTRSRPFSAPETGKIAVKVINHYGDEVLKVYDVRPGGGR